MGELLQRLVESRGRGATGRELVDGFDLDRDARQALLRQLDRMVDDGILTVRAGRYALARQYRLSIGRLKRHRGGHGVVTLAEREEEIFIPQRSLRDGLDGDQVLVLIDGRPPRDGGRRTGEVVAVKERNSSEVLGRFVPGADYDRTFPLPPHVGPPILIPRDANHHGAAAGDLVAVRITGWASRDRAPLGAILSIVGEADDPALDLRIVARKYDLPLDFPDAALAAAARIPQQVQAQEVDGRSDLRHLPFVTIDGETARDFDDAVTVRDEGDDRFRLWVAIADVGHYLPEGGEIDREARRRGTSVYFPDRCLPMLPEALSNGICSLQPDVERLALVVEMLVDREGRRSQEKFYPAVIRSCARLTYTEVQGWLDGGAAGELPLQIKAMARLARQLMEMRRLRGSLDFDLPEAEIALDPAGRPVDIVRRQRTLAHRLIEEFMLAANEAVAEHLVGAGAPLLFRVHEPPAPEKLEALQEFVAHFGYGMNLDDRKGLSAVLQGVLDTSAATPEARAIHQLFLRSMKQAYYTPVNRGHFGLAAQDYCHFTSPIRRYPDLVVHRSLRRLWGGSLRHEQRPPDLLPLGEALSALERRAMEAEREIDLVYKCRFMADKIGMEFEATISSVQPFGLFVELKAHFVEGLVAVATLGDDYYEFDPQRLEMVGQRRRRTFRIGDDLRVRVLRVDPDWREIDFCLVEKVDGRALPRRNEVTTRRRAHRR